MDFNGVKKKINISISNPAIQKEARRYSFRTQLAFLPDEIIVRSWFFRLLTLYYYYVYVYFHAFESKIELRYSINFIFYDLLVVGIEKIDRNQGYLFIARHSTHNGEILGTIVAFYHMTGRVLR